MAGYSGELSMVASSVYTEDDEVYVFIRMDKSELLVE
jgi:hypothetical protein